MNWFYSIFGHAKSKYHHQPSTLSQLRNDHLIPDRPLSRSRDILFILRGGNKNGKQNKELDREKWTVLRENGCDPSSSCGFESGQLEVSLNPRIDPYVDEDGRLVITAGNAMPNSGSASIGHSPTRGDDGDEIASTRLSTYGSADFLHGRVEVRAKVTSGGWGGSSGIWLMPSEERRPDRPSCARVNIVEVICTYLYMLTLIDSAPSSRATDGKLEDN